MHQAKVVNIFCLRTMPQAFRCCAALLAHVQLLSLAQRQLLDISASNKARCCDDLNGGMAICSGYARRSCNLVLPPLCLHSAMRPRVSLGSLELEKCTLLDTADGIFAEHASASASAKGSASADDTSF